MKIKIITILITSLIAGVLAILHLTNIDANLDNFNSSYGTETLIIQPNNHVSFGQKPGRRRNTSRLHLAESHHTEYSSSGFLSSPNIRQHASEEDLNSKGTQELFTSKASKRNYRRDVSSDVELGAAYSATGGSSRLSASRQGASSSASALAQQYRSTDRTNLQSSKMSLFQADPVGVDPDNTNSSDMAQPLAVSGGIWFLLILALGYACIKKIRYRQS